MKEYYERQLAPENITSSKAPGIQKDAKKMSIGSEPVNKTIKELFGTDK